MEQSKDPKYTIAFVVLYFTCGNHSFPDMFRLWIDSCGKNPTIDWYVFTDCKTDFFRMPKNIYIYNTTLEDIKQRFENVLGFDICLNTPYKLCDYRPIYGEAFAKHLEGYDFWGFCDIDLIWGDIRKFLTDDILSGKYSRILSRGHCSLFHNDPITNSLYRTLDRKGCLDYKEVFSSEMNFAFDEWAAHRGGGLSWIMKLNDIPIYDELIFADISICFRRFHLTREYTEAFAHERKQRHRIFRVYSGGGRSELSDKRKDYWIN